MERFLASVAEQELPQENEVSVYICTDGYEGEISENTFSAFRFPIHYFVRPHFGVCATRNYLFQHSFGEYVMFCDCDDMFATTDGFKKLITTAQETSADVIGSAYIAELMHNETIVNRILRQNETRVHGKIFKRSYLEENDICFPEEMTFSGDMYFLYLAYHLTDNVIWLPDIFYTWKWRQESVTRSKEHYAVRTYRQCRKCYTLLLEDLNRRNRMTEYHGLLTSLMIRSYFDWHSDRFLSAPKNFSDDAKDAIRQFVVQYYRDFYEANERDRHDCYIRYQLTRRTYGPAGKYAGLNEWIKDLLDE